MTMKKTTVNSKILTILICLLTLLPSAAKAQVGFDAVSIEAYIKDHKQQRSLLLVRSTLEASNTKALAKIADEGDNLYRSVSDLLLYATGAAACSTSDLLLIITSINNSLDNINKHLNKAYFETWRYIQVRIGYWKKQVYRAKSKEEIISDAFGRWRGAGYLGY